VDMTCAKVLLIFIYLFIYNYLLLIFPFCMRERDPSIHMFRHEGRIDCPTSINQVWVFFMWMIKGTKFHVRLYGCYSITFLDRTPIFEMVCVLGVDLITNAKNTHERLGHIFKFHCSTFHIQHV
jgi:hypothetical protein